MSIKFRITKCLAVSALAMLLLGACSKNNIYIDLADPNEENGNGHPSGNDSGNDNGNPSKEGTLVTFSASVEGRNITPCRLWARDYKVGCVLTCPIPRT